MAFDPLRAPTLAWGPLKPQRDKKERGFGKGGLEKLAQRRASDPPAGEIQMWGSKANNPRFTLVLVPPNDL